MTDVSETRSFLNNVINAFKGRYIHTRILNKLPHGERIVQVLNGLFDNEDNLVKLTKTMDAGTDVFIPLNPYIGCLVSVSGFLPILLICPDAERPGGLYDRADATNPCFELADEINTKLKTEALNLNLAYDPSIIILTKPYPSLGLTGSCIIDNSIVYNPNMHECEIVNSYLPFNV